MKIIDDIFQLKEENHDLCVAIGAFDGIHEGHKNVIKEAIKRAKKIGGKSVVFTFDKHPKSFMSQKTAPKLINSREEKIHLLAELKVDYVVFQKFDKEFSGLTPLEFLKLLKVFRTREIFVGFNFRFGAGGAATVDDMIKIGKTCGIEVNKTKPVTSGKKVISSTLIRELITGGELETAKILLGYNLFIIGRVVHGKKYGRQLGFPTANLKLMDKIYPPFGIYGAKVQIEGYGEIYDGVVNIGRNPTLKDGELSVETHILNFSDYIYGKKVIVELIKNLRTEKKFNSIDELKKAIANDVLIWKDYLQSN
ncbi:MAG: bifunctional riboflavin kinase/FAD synthetase [Psychrilyobacter sp.]|uniref:bifunctional riboflavin kinase/FAD synthetase n=1 Tax=Psychrilyobacter sp. TaxID=2586924 RepID=UPI003C7600D9